MAAVTMEDLLQPHLLHMSQKKKILISKGLCRLIFCETQCIRKTAAVLCSKSADIILLIFLELFFTF